MTRLTATRRDRLARSFSDPEARQLVLGAGVGDADGVVLGVDDQVLVLVVGQLGEQGALSTDSRLPSRLTRCSRNPAIRSASRCG